jgi:hypothetical protein
MPAQSETNKKQASRLQITKRSDFHFKVPARSDRKHSWSQHADSDSYLYQVLRRWEHLAKLNHGFVYETTGATAKNAHHYRQDDAPCKRVVRRIKAFCREKGIISEEARGTSQWGHRVRGFYLANHADCCRMMDGYHVFFSEYNAKARRIRFTGQSQDRSEVRPKSPQSPSEVLAKSYPPRVAVPPDGPACVPGETAEVADGEPDMKPERGNDTRPGTWFGCLESLESCQSLESCESSGGSMNVVTTMETTSKSNPNATPTAKAFFSDLTVTTNRTTTIENRNRTTRTRTIGDHFHTVDKDTGNALGELSGGCFDPRSLAKYPHKEELRMACLFAIDELCDEPFVGSTTRAQILGRAMERLKSDGINAPPYFPKLLRELRDYGRTESQVSSIRPDAPTNGQPCISASPSDSDFPPLF